MMNGNIPAIDLARYVIWYACSKKRYITNLKLQKLLYYLQGEYLRRHGKLLFSDTIEAWPYGPVVPKVYYEYCKNGALWLYPEEDGFNALDGYNGQIKEDIDDILDKYLPFNARELVNKSHMEGPWRRHEDAVNQGDKPQITEEEMRDQFHADRELVYG